MSRQGTVKLNKNTTNDENSSNEQDNASSTGLTTKLERRRRIEELNEEPRLREELNAF